MDGHEPNDGHATPQILFDDEDRRPRDFGSADMSPIPRREAEYAPSVRLRRRREIESNDPSLDRLGVGYLGFCPPDGDWQRDGEGVGRNTRLEELTMSHVDDVSRDDVERFCRGVADNRSIVNLTLGCCDFLDTVFDLLVPLFEKNTNLKVLDVTGAGARGINSLAVSLENNTSLKSITIRCPDYEDVDVNEAMENLCTTLAAHPSLKKLHLYHVELGRAGSAALLPLLQSTNSGSMELCLKCNEIDDDGMAGLSAGLRRCTAVQKLRVDLRQNSLVTGVGWRSFATCLDGPTCRLSSLVIREDCLNDALAIALADALMNNTHLRSLDIRYHQDIIVSGWRAFAALLRSPRSQLGELLLNGCGINNEATLALASSLINNSSLKRLFLDNSRIDISGWQALTDLLRSPRSKLEGLSLQNCGICSFVASPLARALDENNCLTVLWLSSNHAIPPPGLRAILSALARPDSALEELYLHNCCVTDEAVTDLANALNVNNKLRVLDISSNPRITVATWRIIAASLQNPSSSLEKLDLRNNRISDGSAIMFANSLASNTKLKELNLGYNRGITEAAWRTFSRVLCDGTSIMDTYNSNHFLQVLHPYPMIHDIISIYEKMNRNEKKTDVARQKIIKHHFCGGTNIEPFVDKKLELLPYVVTWMAKEVTDINDGGRSLLYLFLKHDPLLLESRGRVKKKLKST